MASPQIEEGAIHIALDLYMALMRYDFTALELRAIHAVIYFTWGAGKTKAEISTEDIRYMLGASDKLRTDRLEVAIESLIARNILFKQDLVNGKRLLALQKDYDQWADKMSGPSINTRNITTKKLSSIGPDKLSIPQKLLEYVQRKNKFKYSVTSYRVEQKYAKRVYIQALSLTLNSRDALLAIKDYIDENEWMRKNVRHQFTYMDSRFEQWYRQIPRKPREIREDEEALGRRYRYNVSKKQWEVAE